MALTFAQLSPDINQFTNDNRVISELGKKVFGGVQTCRTLIALHQETAQLLHSFSFKANELHLRYRKLIPPSIFSSLGEMEGFLKVFLLFQNIFNIWSETTADLGHVLVNDCVLYMEQVVTQLERKKKEFLVLETVPDHPLLKSNQVFTLQNTNEKNILSNNWATDSSLNHVEYPDNTLQSKGKTKIQTNSSELSTTLMGFSIKEDCYYMLDNWELIRLQSIKEMLQMTLQAFKRFHSNSEKLVNNFSRSIESFRPEEDIQKWLQLLLNDPTLFIAEKNNVAKVTVTFSNAIDHSSSSDTLLLRDSGFLERKSSEHEVTNENEDHQVLSHLDDDITRKSSTEDPKVDPLENHMALTTTQNSFDFKSMTPLVHSSSSSFHEGRSDVLLRSQKTISSHESPLSELPNLYDYLNRPLVKISNSLPFERFFEIQRRLEEYLLSVAKFEMKKNSLTTSWDDPYFQQSLPILDMASFYPYTLPSGSVKALSSRKNNMALEWGSVCMDEHQWNCMAYECLLLVYEYLHNEVVLMQSDKNYLKKKYQMPMNKPTLKKKVQDFNPLQKKKNNESVSKTDTIRSQFDIDLCREVKTYDLQVISDLLTLTRLKFGLSGQTNGIIYKLTLGGCVSNAMGYSTTLHPLDLRYRLVRLIDSWHAIENNLVVFSKPSEKTAFHEWVMRQIHMIHSGISFKFWRFLRFISNNRQIFNILNFWPEHGPLYRFESCDLSSCFIKTTEYIQPVIDFLLNAFLQCFSILLNLSSTLKMGCWGFMTNDPTDTLRYSPSELLNLLTLMKSIGFYDKTIRFHIMQSEKLERKSEKTLGKKNYFKGQNKRKKSSYGHSSNKYSKSHFITLGSYWRYEAPMIQFFMSRLWCSVIDTSTPNFLNPDAPRLALGLLLTCHVMEYGVDHAGVLQDMADTFFFASLSLQCHCFLLVKALWKEIISQPAVSKEEKEIKVSSYIFPVEALKMMLHFFSVINFIKWIFANMLHYTRKSLVPEFFSHQSKLLDRTCINARTVLAEKCNRLLLHSILNPWIALTFHPSFNGIATRINKLDFYVLDMHYLQKYVEELDTRDICMCLSHLISAANRLIHDEEITAMTYLTNLDEFKSVNDKNLSLRGLQVKNSANRLMKQFKLSPLPISEFKLKIQEANDLTNYELISPRKLKKQDSLGGERVKNTKSESKAMKSQVHLAYYNFYSNKANLPLTIKNIKPCYSIRPEPEGFSLILPGRVERVTMEIFYTRQFLLHTIKELIDILSGYHNQLDPNTLPIALNILTELLNSFSKNTSEEFKECNTAFMNFSLPLGLLLKGPTDQHDYYRFFIHENILRLINNLFKECRSALLMSKESEESHEDNTKICEIFALYSNVTCKLVNEIRGELLYFTAPWNQFLKGNQHAIIVMDATRKTLLGHFVELVDSTKSQQTDFVRYGFKLFQALHKLEVLFWDAKQILNMNLSLEPSLFQPFMEMTQLSIQKKCNDMEVVIKRCVAKDTFQPVGRQSYSSSVLDFFTFLHTFISTLFESYIPLDWILDSFLSAFHRMVAVFCKEVVQDFKNIVFLHLMNEIETVFRTLRAPLGPQTNSLTDYQGFHSSEMSKYLPKSLKKANVFKLFKKKKKPLESKKLDKKLKKPTTSVPREIDSILDKEPESTQDSDSSKSSDALSSSRVDGNTLEVPSKNVSKPKETIKRPFDLPETSFNHIKERFGNNITLEYFTVQEYFRSVSLKSCLVRFHNLTTFRDKLNGFHDYCLKKIEKQLAERDIRFSDLMQTLTASKNAEKKTLENNYFHALNEYRIFFENSLQVCNGYLDDTQNELIRLVATRIALIEFGEDFFESLYHPFFKDFKFENILNGLKDTVDWFILKLPHSVQQQFRFHIIEIFVKLWCFMISQTGLNGTIFLPEDIAVLKADLNTLVAYLQNCKTMPSPFKVMLYPSSTHNNENATNTFPIVLTDYVHEFFIWLSQHPSVLCDLGGMFVHSNATKSTKQSKKKQAFIPTPPTDNLTSKSLTKLSDANMKSSSYFSVPKTVKHLKKNKMTWIENFF